MEQDIKQHVITPLKGICNTPSDLTCDDEQLAVCEGLVNVNGELVPVQKPKKNFNASFDSELMYIHDYNGTKRYIAKDGNILMYHVDGELNHIVVRNMSTYIYATSVSTTKSKVYIELTYTGSDGADVPVTIDITKGATSSSNVNIELSDEQFSNIKVSNIYTDDDSDTTNYVAVVPSHSNYEDFLVNSSKGDAETKTIYNYAHITRASDGKVVVNTDITVKNSKTIDISIKYEKLYTDRVKAKYFVCENLGKIALGEDARSNLVIKARFLLVNGAEYAYRPNLGSIVYFIPKGSRIGTSIYGSATLNFSYAIQPEFAVVKVKSVDKENGTYTSCSNEIVSFASINLDYSLYYTTNTYEDKENRIIYQDDWHYMIKDAVNMEAHEMSNELNTRTQSLPNESVSISKTLSIIIGKNSATGHSDNTITEEDFGYANIQNAVKVNDKEYKVLIEKYTTYITSEGGEEYIGNETDIIELNIVKNFGDVEIIKVSSIGNTLIVNTSNGLWYFLWSMPKDGTRMIYKELGNSIPEPNITFSRVIVNYDFEVGDNADSDFGKFPTTSTSGICYVSNNIMGIENKTAFVDAVNGAYSEAVNYNHKNELFTSSVFVRCAVELKDGTYCNITNPILINIGDDSSNIKIVWYCIYEGQPEMYVKLDRAFIKVTNKTDYSYWSDIISNVVIFVSKEIDNNKTLNNPDGSYTASSVEQSGYLFNNIITKYNSTTIKNKITDYSIFYKLCDIGLKPVSNFDTRKNMDENTIGNTSVTLTNEDYFGNSKLYPNNINTFNRRLILSGVKRTFFDGFSTFSTNEYSDSHSYTIYVKIKTSQGIAVVKKDVTTKEILDKGLWFFYPDTRAYYFCVFDNSSNCMVYESELKEHPRLNGAYCFNIVSENLATRPSAISAQKPDVHYFNERLDNYLLQSQVDNPFVFNASSYTRVGNGEIIGISALTTALTNDSYKVSNVLCFTTQGIWAILSNSEGQFVSVPPSFSREVCTDASTITMVDNAVFFVSQKGLMMISDSNGCVCVSKQLNGKGRSYFMNFIKDCSIAYDYRDNMLIISRKDTLDVWIYDITSGTFSTKYNILGYGIPIIKSCVDYPDTAIQDSEYNIYSLTNKNERDIDPNSYSATLESRPMKLDGSSYLKSLRRAKNIMMLDSGATHTLKLYGSNDIKNWYELPSLQGKPWRFFKYKIQFSNLKATDTFSGLLLQTQVRYTEKPR